MFPTFDDLSWETFLDVLKEDVSWMIFPHIPIVLYWISAQIFLTYSCASLRYSLFGKDYNSISGGYRFIRFIINVLPVLLSCLTIVICCLIQIFIKLKNLTIQNYAIAVVWTLTIMSMLDMITLTMVDIMIYETALLESSIPLIITIIPSLIISYGMSVTFFKILRLDTSQNKFLLKFEVSSSMIYHTTMLLFVIICIMCSVI